MDVHFTWIGPPKAGQDTDAAIVMSQVLGAGYDVHFWCLDAHVGTYTAALGDHDITVHGIESFLAQAQTLTYRWWNWYGNDEQWAIEQMLQVLEAAKNAPSTPPKRRLREIVNAKNAFAYLLTYTWGGFVMDTNVGPDPGHPLQLGNPTEFMAPFLEGSSTGYGHYDGSGNASLYGPCIGGIFGTRLLSNLEIEGKVGGAEQEEFKGGKIPDVWMLYSPRYSAEAWRALRGYFWRWQQLRELGQELEDGDEDAYNDWASLCATAVSDSLIDGLMHGPAGCGTIGDEHRWAFTTEVQGGHNYGIIPALGIRKKYDGSHRNDLPAPPPPASDEAIELTADGPSSDAIVIVIDSANDDDSEDDFDAPDDIESALGGDTGASSSSNDALGGGGHSGGSIPRLNVGRAYGNSGTVRGPTSPRRSSICHIS